MTVKKAVIESAFSFQLWRRLFLINLHAFTITGSEGVRDGVCFSLQVLTESDLVKLQASVKKAVRDSVTEFLRKFAISFRL